MSDLDEAVRLARKCVADGYSEEMGLLARALIAAVGERDVVRNLVAVCNRDGSQRLDAIEAWYLLGMERDTAIARADRAEAALADKDDELRNGRIVRDNAVFAERARVVEEIAAWHDARAVDLEGLPQASQHRLSATHTAPPGREGASMSKHTIGLVVPLTDAALVRNWVDNSERGTLVMSVRKVLDENERLRAALVEACDLIQSLGRPALMSGAHTKAVDALARLRRVAEGES